MDFQTQRIYISDRTKANEVLNLLQKDSQKSLYPNPQSDNLGSLMNDSDVFLGYYEQDHLLGMVSYETNNHVVKVNRFAFLPAAPKEKAGKELLQKLIAETLDASNHQIYVVKEEAAKKLFQKLIAETPDANSHQIYVVKEDQDLQEAYKALGLHPQAHCKKDNKKDFLLFAHGKGSSKEPNPFLLSVGAVLFFFSGLWIIRKRRNKMQRSKKAVYLAETAAFQIYRKNRKKWKNQALKNNKSWAKNRKYLSKKAAKKSQDKDFWKSTIQEIVAEVKKARK